jgi:hypothetical protein
MADEPGKVIDIRPAAVVDPPPTTARQRADQIKTHLTSAAESWEAVRNLAATAYEQRDWEALDFSSWEVYCRQVFGSHLLRLSEAMRIEITAELLQAGASTREIAPATGVSQATASRDAAKVTGPRKPKAKAKPGPKSAAKPDLGKASREARGTVKRLVDSVATPDLPESERKDWVLLLGGLVSRFSRK